MRGLIRTAVAFGAMGFVGIDIVASWPIAEPVHLGMLTGDAYRGAYLARSGGCTFAVPVWRPGGLPLLVERRLIRRLAVSYRRTSRLIQFMELATGLLNQFAVALRQGVRPDSKAYYPAFPYEFYADLSDQDVADLWAAIQTVPPVSVAAPESDVSFLFNLRWGLKLWRAAYMSPAKISPVMGQSQEWNRGKQLVTGPAHCAACHTGRNMLGGLKESEALAGNDNLPGGSKAPAILAADLVAKGWTVANMAYALRTGVMPDGDVFGGGMAEVVQAGTSCLDEADREAIATYLLDQPGIPAPPDTPVANAGMAGMVHTPGMQMNVD